MMKEKSKKQRQKSKISKELIEKIEQELARGDIPKVLILGTAPFIKSSEGVISNYLGDKLLSYGVPTILVARYGIDTGGFFKFGNLTVLPIEKEEDPEGITSTMIYYLRFGLDVIISLIPFWKNGELFNFPTIVVANIEGEEYPTEYLENLKKFKYIVAPSMFAEKELRKYGIDSTYIPYGVDTKSFIKYSKIESKKLFNIGENEFCIGIVGSNKSKEPKKGWDSSFETIKLFFEEHPEVREKTRILIHTRRKDKDGLDLEELARQFGINDRIIWQDQFLITIGLPTGTLARMYSAMDVLLNLSRYETSNLAVLEASSCGVPSIVTNFGIMKERVNFGKIGYLVPVKELVPNENGIKVAVPNVEEASKILWEAYTNSREREKLGEKARSFVQNYSWDIIVGQKWIPYLQKVYREERKKTSEG